ncbi:MAG TPA: hypothetical protein VHV53_00735 [Solirubrobacterales bacterium]|nr:hypothetical protein [Solirubrobacterales bacterium]
MDVTPIEPQTAGEHPIYVVAGGNRVTIELDRAATGGVVDAIEVLAGPGGGPPPHRHEFGEWFLVRAGTLTICEERDGTVVCTREVPVGGSFRRPSRPAPMRWPRSPRSGASSSGPARWTRPRWRTRTDPSARSSLPIHGAGQGDRGSRYWSAAWWT